MLNIDIDGKLGLTVQDCVGQRMAIMGSSGMGKSNTNGVLLEELLPHIPFVIFDVHNEYWGLCEQFEILRVGKSPEMQLQIERGDAKALAELVYSRRVSMIVNMLSELPYVWTPEERLEFVADFCNTLWQLNTKTRKPFGILIEEAHNFIPEAQGKNNPALTAINMFASEGRKFGFTTIFSSQRTQKVSKDILSVCNIVLLHGVNIYNDFQAYQGMLPYTLAETKKIAMDLGVGEIIARIKLVGRPRFEQVKIRPRKTFHVGETPTFGKDDSPPLLTMNDDLLTELRSALKQTEAAEDGDVSPAPAADDQHVRIAELEARIVTLESDHAAAIAALKREYDIEIARLKQVHQQEVTVLRNRRPVVDEPPVRQLELLAVGAAAEDVHEVMTTTTTTRVERHVSSRQATIIVKRQARAFGELIQTIQGFTPMHRALLAYALERDGQAMRMNEVARTVDYSLAELRRRANQIAGMGLFAKINAEVYESSVGTYIQQHYDRLEYDHLIQKLWEVVGG